MDEFILYCYSQGKDYPKPLADLLKKRYKNEATQKFINKKDLLLYSLADNIDPSPDLIVLILKNKSPETIGLINKINQLAPLTIKLVIAETKILLAIQSQIAYSDSLQFLRSSWDDNEVELALNTAEFRSSLNGTDKKNNSVLLNQRVEKEVAERFHKLVDSNIAKDKILSIIAHDLKTPFHGLLGITDILLCEWQNLEEIEKIGLISDAKETAKETLKLLKDLLDWSKSQKEKLEISIEEIKVHNLVDTSIKVNESCAIPKGIKVQNKINNKLKINADAHMIATVFRNLISNAVKFTRPGGNIQITAKGNKNYLTFCVSDNGFGIDKTQIIDIFKSNKKPENSNGFNNDNVNGKIEHRGLGLLLCKDFVERSGGKIWVETQKGVGSKFFFTLPC